MKRKVGKEPEGVTKKRKVMIDMNGPDIEAVDEVKALILQSVTVEELQEEDAVKEHCRCNPIEQERTRHK